MSTLRRSRRITLFYIHLFASISEWLRRQSDDGPAFRRTLAGLDAILNGLKKGRTRPAVEEAAVPGRRRASTSGIKPARRLRVRGRTVRAIP